jgi:hypothetical protein
VKVQQDEIGIMLFGRQDGGVGIVRRSHYPIARIVFDQIFERCRQLAVIFDDKNP